MDCFVTHECCWSDGLFHSSRHAADLSSCRGTTAALQHFKASSQSGPAELLSAPPSRSPSPWTELPLPTADVILVTRSLVCAGLRDAPVHYVAVKNSSGFNSGTSAPPFLENSGGGVCAHAHARLAFLINRMFSAEIRF